MVDAEIVKTVDEYKWSSIGWYMNQDNYLKDLVNTNLLLGVFASKGEEARKQFLEYMRKIYRLK